MRLRTVFTALCLAQLLLVPTAARADNAPMWETPVGLAPGNPGSLVQLRSEQVDVEIVELETSVVLDVRAVFDMVNHGDDVDLLVGFPSWTLSSPAAEFRPSSLRG